MLLFLYFSLFILDKYQEQLMKSAIDLNLNLNFSKFHKL